jgi:hypothetical protein
MTAIPYLLALFAIIFFFVMLGAEGLPDRKEIRSPSH